MTTGSIVRNQRGSIVGRVIDRIFIKDVFGSRHMLRQPMAWAIDADIFDRVIVPNCISIHIVDKETGTKYVASVKTFSEKKQVINRGYGKQYLLELIYWQPQRAS